MTVLELLTGKITKMEKDQNLREESLEFFITVLSARNILVLSLGLLLITRMAILRRNLTPELVRDTLVKSALSENVKIKLYTQDINYLNT